MITAFTAAQTLFGAYSQSMERTSKVFGFVIFAVGVVILIAGLRKTVRYLRIVTTKYRTVPGKIVDCIKEERQIKHGKQTDYYPVMEFEYEGRIHTVKSRVPYGASTVAAFNEADMQGTLEIRVPKDDIDGALPELEANRGSKLMNGLQICGIGLAFAVAGLVFMLT